MPTPPTPQTTKKVLSLPEPKGGNRVAVMWAVKARSFIAERVKDKGVSATKCADVLLSIAHYVALFDDPIARPSYDTIAEMAIVSRSQAAQAIKILAHDLKLIEAVRQERNKPNIYRFCVPEVLRASTPTAQPEADAPDTEEDTQPSAPPKPEPNAFDVYAYIKAHETIAGVPRKDAAAAIRWNVCEREDDKYWHTWLPKSAEALEVNVRTMVEQYREHLQKTAKKTTARQYEMQPAYQPREYGVVERQEEDVT